MRSGGANRIYRTQEFAELAGVTVRALHHYDRLGLLRARRSGAGYRLYSVRDLERLEQIVALKFLGLSLQQIRTLLERERLALPEALRMQRTVLEGKRSLLDRAIRAIEEAEEAIRPGRQADAAILKKIIEVIGMQDNTDWMMKYHTGDAKARIAARRQEWTPELQEQVSRQWTELMAEVETVLGEDPGGPKAQALAERWTKLVEGFTGGDPEVASGVKRLYADQANWPASAKEYMTPFLKPEVWKFMDRAIAIRKGK
jgi:DNA-binding transcriptional MerR regulator